jgi:hypothetical protein
VLRFLVNRWPQTLKVGRTRQHMPYPSHAV